MRVIFDNNVLISAALLKNSIPFIALKKATTSHILLCSRNIFNEFFNTIYKPKFDRYFVDNFARDEFIISFISITINIEVNHAIDICRDPKDNMYLELALSGNADIIITGDTDLLVLHPFGIVSIITPKHFIDHY